MDEGELLRGTQGLWTRGVAVELWRRKAGSVEVRETTPEVPSDLVDRCGAHTVAAYEVRLSRFDCRFGILSGGFDTAALLCCRY